ncbi:WD repeat domain 39 [Aphelenchoides avenae]|nr:WD repeat domain 39 [Aphelenchus avenae]KAH7727647.1 WD repeat domain 39 [Aphelenchus avenae]
MRTQLRILEYADDKLELLSKIGGDHLRTVRCATFSPCGRYLATASFDASVIVYEFRNGDFEEIHKLEGHENEIKGVVYSASGQFLATCSRDKSVWVWQVDEDEDYEVGSILQNHTADVKFVAWHPTEDVLVSGGYDCSIRFYRFDGEDWVTQQAIADAHQDTIWSGAFDSTGEYFVSVGADRAVKIWQRVPGNSISTSTWKKAVELVVEDTRWPLYSVAWNPLHNVIATGGGDKKVRFFTFDSNNTSLLLSGSTKLDDEVNGVSWNPKRADVLAVACEDGTVKLLQDKDIVNCSSC